MSKYNRAFQHKIYLMNEISTRRKDGKWPYCILFSFLLLLRGLIGSSVNTTIEYLQQHGSCTVNICWKCMAGMTVNLKLKYGKQKTSCSTKHHTISPRMSSIICYSRVYWVGIVEGWRIPWKLIIKGLRNKGQLYIDELISHFSSICLEKSEKE